MNFEIHTKIFTKNRKNHCTTHESTERYEVHDVHIKTLPTLIRTGLGTIYKYESQQIQNVEQFLKSYKNI